jgi:hypothetical protein
MFGARVNDRRAFCCKLLAAAKAAKWAMTGWPVKPGGDGVVYAVRPSAPVF